MIFLYLKKFWVVCILSMHIYAYSRIIYERTSNIIIISYYILASNVSSSLFAHHVYK